jgi:hypothetical protein
MLLVDASTAGMAIRERIDLPSGIRAEAGLFESQLLILLALEELTGHCETPNDIVVLRNQSLRRCGVVQTIALEAISGSARAQAMNRTNR